MWIVYVSDVAGRPDEWYDVALIRDLLVGPGEDVLSLADQVRIVEDNWAAIKLSFGTSRRQETHARLAHLYDERLDRRLPGLRKRD